MKSQQTCPGKELLFAYAVHVLEPAEEQRVRTHLDRCLGCRSVVAGYQHLEQTLDEWTPVAPSPWFDARTRARVLSSTQPRSHSLLGSSWQRWVVVAAVMVLVAIAGAVVFRSHATRSQARVEAVAKNASTPFKEPAPAPPEAKTVATQQSAEQELNLYKNLHVLENYDMLANFDVLSELPQPGSKVND